MTFEKIYDDLVNRNISPQDARDLLSTKEKSKQINSFLHRDSYTQEPLNTNELQDLNALVNILQTIFNSSVPSPVADTDYDILEEMLVNMGIPRLTGSVELNDSKKISHKFTNLRGTLDKVYYLTNDEPRTNKSRKTLDEWIKSTERLYYEKTGRNINLNETNVILQPKFDGVSAIDEITDNNMIWITRGDTRNNKASDVSHILGKFNDQYKDYNNCGIKFEVMCSEENKDKINSLMKVKYSNSRQVVISTLNSNEVDFKVEYLTPIPLREMYVGDIVESVSPWLLGLPECRCKLKDRDQIRRFAFSHRYVIIDGQRFRTDGCVITIADKSIAEVLGRDNNINNFEVAFKFTEEAAYTKVKDVEFYVSNFSYITPVLVVNDVIMKGNNVNRISLSNKERFDELDLHYGDMVKVLYDIIPYAVIDNNCKRVPNGRKIEFIDHCPMCRAKLDLNQTIVRCTNPECPSRIIGRVLNYCETLRIHNIGYSTLETLHSYGLLDEGIKSLYRLKKHTSEIENLEGFGKAKTRKIISEIESKRTLKDYEFFGAIGIDQLSTKTFQLVFKSIKLVDMMNMIKSKNSKLILANLKAINGLGPIKAQKFVDFVCSERGKSELGKLLKEVKLIETYGNEQYIGRVTFTGCRSDDETAGYLISIGYDPYGSFSSATKYVVRPNDSFTSSTVEKALKNNIPIISINENNIIDLLRSNIK